MYPKTVIEYNNFGRKTALATFLTGGFIVALYYYTAFSGMIFISLFFIISFFLLNTVVSVSLIKLLLKNKKDQKSILITLFLMSLNLPVGYAYLQFGFKIYAHTNI
ncbi:hypothetical protein [Flavobacterium sp. TBRC 19031]|uniref:hypothetical protein n=1 Tax=Flavobacterium mekongense TaxID=3379707 RepID=UPI00399A5F35